MRCIQCGAVMQSKVIANRPYKRKLTRYSCSCGHEQTESDRAESWARVYKRPNDNNDESNQEETAVAQARADLYGDDPFEAGGEAVQCD